MEHSSLKEAVQTSRFIKDYSKEIDVKIPGRPSKEMEQLYTRFETTIDSLKDRNQDWIKQKQDTLREYLREVPEQEVEHTFREGARIFFKQQYRLFRKDSPNEVQKLYDNSYLEDQTSAYFFDFYRTLRTTERLGINVHVGLQIAKMSYSHNPDLLIELTQKFPEFDVGQITRIVTINTHPENGLLRLRDAVTRLEEKYPEEPKGLLTYAALHRPKNPDGYIEKVNGAIPQLETDFPNFKPGVIRTAAIYYLEDPAGFLRGVETVIPALEEKFPDIAPSTIAEVAVGRPKNPEVFLTTMLKHIPQLRLQFPGFTDSILQEAYVGHTKNPEKFLEQIRDSLPEFQKQFPEFKEGEILSALVSNPKTAQRILEDAQKQLPELLSQYSTKSPAVPDWVIREILIVKRAQPAEVRLDKMLEDFAAFKKEHPDVSDITIFSALRRNPSDPRKYLEYRQQLNESRRVA